MKLISLTETYNWTKLGGCKKKKTTTTRTKSKKKDPKISKQILGWGGGGAGALLSLSYNFFNLFFMKCQIAGQNEADQKQRFRWQR